MRVALDPHGLFCDSFDLTINKKMAPGKLYNDPLITVNGQILTYLINSSTLEAVSPEQCAIDD